VAGRTLTEFDVLFGPPFFVARFESIRTIGHMVEGNGTQQLQIEVLVEASATLSLKVD
jgi:hypothetical protein